MNRTSRSWRSALFGSVLGRLPVGITRNLVSMGTASALARGMTFVTMVYSARVLGTGQFGLLSYGMAIAAYATILVGPGFLVWGVRAIAQDPPRAGSYLAIVNLIQIALAGVAYALLVLVTTFWFGEAERRITLVAGLSVFSIAASVEWVCQGLERFRLIGAAQITASFLTLLLTFSLVRSPADVSLVPLISTANQLLLAGITLWLLLRKQWISLAGIDPKQIRAILAGALPLGISGAMITILHYANSVILHYYRGPNDLGIFTAALRLVEILAPIPLLISNVLLPSLTRTRLTDPKRLAEQLRAAIHLVMSIGCLPAAVFAVEARNVVEIVYSEEFATAAEPLRTLSIAVPFMFAAVIYINGLLVLNYDKIYFWSLFVAMVVSIAGGMVLVPTLGIRGAAATYACLDLTVVIVAFPAYRRTFGSLFLREWARPVMAGAVASVWLLAAGRLGLTFWLRLPLGALAYSALAIRRPTFGLRPGGRTAVQRDELQKGEDLELESQADRLRHSCGVE